MIRDEIESFLREGAEERYLFLNDKSKEEAFDEDTHVLRKKYPGYNFENAIYFLENDATLFTIYFKEKESSKYYKLDMTVVESSVEFQLLESIS
jgi:hypothetical protein